MTAVLDASAFLAYAFDEPGAQLVEAAMGEGAVMSAVNLAESLTRLADALPGLGDQLAGASAELADRDHPRASPELPGAAGILLPGAFTVEPFGPGDAIMSAALRDPTRARGLSLGDRACLALGRRLGSAVLTADRDWAALDAGVDVQVIR